jgi:hypothetical protein
MEYMYADAPDPESYPVNTGSTTVGYNKLVNSYMLQTVGNTTQIPTNQIYNFDVDYDITHNTSNNSVVQIADNSFVTLDPNLIIPFNNYSPKLTPDDQLAVTFPGNIVVVYDSIKYHIVAGYNLSNLDGVIINIKYQDSNGTYVTFSQILIEKGTQQDYSLNPTPLKFGSNIYDRYFEIKIPSLKDMNDRYQAAASSFRDQTLAYLTSNSNAGYVYGSPMRIEIWYVREKTDFNGYERYNSEQVAVLSLESEDPFSNIGATIKLSEAGQFFEYFATDNEGFIEDFILFQNSIGNNYYINHTIETFEQIGEASILTNTFTTTQTTAYDLPNYYRPIVRNPSTAVSFTLRYTMALVNNVNRQSVIRVGTYTSNNPGQWGPNIAPIQLSTFPQVQKIYNKIVSQAPLNIPSPATPSPTQIVTVNNVFIDKVSVSASVSPILITGPTGSTSAPQVNEVALPSGQTYIEVSPFDNFYLFKFYKTGFDASPIEVNLGETKSYKLAFIDERGTKNYISSFENLSVANPIKGEVAFKIDDSISTKILNYKDRRFFITSGSAASDAKDITGSQMSGTVLSSSQPIVANPSINTAPISVIYWGYWKAFGEQTQTTPGATASSIGNVAASASTGIKETTQRIDSIIRKVKGTTNSAASLLYSLSPAAGATSAASKFSKSPSASSGTVKSNTLTQAEIIQGVSGIVAAFKANGWTDQSIINYFLVPGQLGYKQFPGLTATLFIQAVGSTINVSSLNIQKNK